MKCKISSSGCVYHACMSDDCQKRYMLEGLTKNFYGIPDCKTKLTTKMAKSKIEWCDQVWNPITGCTKISEGCNACYAERMAKRLAGRFGYPKINPFAVTSHHDRIYEPSKWKKPQRVFVGSMGDIFHPDVPEHWIDAIMVTAALFRKHTFMILTKRPQRMLEYFNRPKEEILKSWEESIQQIKWNINKLDTCTCAAQLYSYCMDNWPVPNIWLGVTTENQATTNQRLPLLLKTPAAKRFISAEPLLGPINYMHFSNSLLNTKDHPWKNTHLLSGIDWVICGGETGPKARPMHPDWVRLLRDQCIGGVHYKVPFFFKGWGVWSPEYKSEHEATCVVCGCTENNACEGGCSWIENTMLDICSKCGNAKTMKWEDNSLSFHRGKKKSGHMLDDQEYLQFPKTTNNEII
jgi:protein gp37